MKFKHYLDEQIKDFSYIFNLIDKDCKPFLKELKGTNKLLWRGSQSVPEEIERKRVRKDRKPRLLPWEIHKFLSDESKKFFGWDIRREGLFAVNNVFYARRWGEPVIIFPIGQFKYVWIKNVDVLYSLYGKFEYGNIEEKNKKRILDILKKDYKAHNLRNYIKSTTNGECIINCNEYYMVNKNYEHDLIREYSK